MKYGWSWATWPDWLALARIPTVWGTSEDYPLPCWPSPPRHLPQSKQEGLFTASGIRNFRDENNCRSPYPNLSVHRGGSQGPERWSDYPKAPRTLNCRHRTGATVSASPSGPLPTTPHCNFTALNHGSLRNISFNCLRPGAQPCWAVLLGQMEICTLLWYGGRIFWMRRQIGHL